MTVINATSQFVPTNWPLHKRVVELTELLFIAQHFQYILWNEIIIDGTVQIDGELVIL